MAALDIACRLADGATIAVIFDQSGEWADRASEGGGRGGTVDRRGALC